MFFFNAFYLHIFTTDFFFFNIINLDCFPPPTVSFTLIRLSLSVPLGESVTDVLHINMLYVNLHACHLSCTPPPFNLDLHSPRFSVFLWYHPPASLLCLVFLSHALIFHLTFSFWLLFLSVSCHASIAFSRTSELLVLSLSTYCKGSTYLQ